MHDNLSYRAGELWEPMPKIPPSTKRSRMFLRILGFGLCSISLVVTYSDGYLDLKVCVLFLIGLLLSLVSKFASDKIVNILEALFTGW